MPGDDGAAAARDALTLCGRELNRKRREAALAATCATEPEGIYARWREKPSGSSSLRWRSGKPSISAITVVGKDSQKCVASEAIAGW